MARESFRKVGIQECAVHVRVCTQVPVCGPHVCVRAPGRLCVRSTCMRAWLQVSALPCVCAHPRALPLGTTWAFCL